MKKALLKPLSMIYEVLTTARNFLYDLKILNSYKSKLPIICVGNIAVGGSGKSPIAQFLAVELSKKMRVTILSRGYQGQIKGPHCVCPEDTAVEVGDEAVMHYRVLADLKVPVIVSRSRVAGAKYIEQHDLAELIILDDGFQHRALARDLNLLLIDVSSKKTLEELKKNLLLPAGYLRETGKQAFNRADAIIFVSRGENCATKEELQVITKENKTIFNVSLTSRHFRKSNASDTYLLEHFIGKRGSAITAIAKPEAFFADLENSGIVLSSKKSFKDHYLFCEDDFSELEEPIFITAKDSVKLDMLLLAQKKEVYVLEQSVDFEDSVSFFSFLHRSLNL